MVKPYRPIPVLAVYLAIVLLLAVGAQLTVQATDTKKNSEEKTLEGTQVSEAENTAEANQEQETEESITENGKVEILKNYMQKEEGQLTITGSDKIKSLAIKPTTSQARKDTIRQTVEDSEEIMREKQEIEELIHFNNRLPVIQERLDSQSEEAMEELDSEDTDSEQEQAEDLEKQKEVDSLTDAIDEVNGSGATKVKMDKSDKKTSSELLPANSATGDQSTVMHNYLRTDELTEDKQQLVEEEVEKLTDEGVPSTFMLFAEVKKAFKDTEHAVSVNNISLDNSEKAYFLVLITVVLPILIVVSLSVCVGHFLKENLYSVEEGILVTRVNGDTKQAQQQVLQPQPKIGFERAAFWDSFLSALTTNNRL